VPTVIATPKFLKQADAIWTTQEREANGAESMQALKKLSVEKVAAAIAADAGQVLPGLREALAVVKAGQAGRVHTPEQVVARRRSRVDRG